MEMICKILHGSHIYGLNTPESDKDYKAVYLPTLEDLILKKDSDHILENSNDSNTKNTKDDIDFETFSLHRFLNLVMNGQPMAIEMLFAPKRCLIQTSGIWNNLIFIREKLLSKQINAFVGYCRGQSSKYCMKGERLEALGDLIEILKRFPKKNKLGIHFNQLTYEMPTKWNKLFKRSETKKGVISFKFLGKEYDIQSKISYILDSLIKVQNRYGHRAEKAKEMKGNDWKALSHALRVAMEAKEILQTGKLRLPIKRVNGAILYEIKTGKMPREKVEELLSNILNEMDEIQEKSTLPEKPNKDLFDGFILNIYENRIKHQ